MKVAEELFLNLPNENKKIKKNKGRYPWMNHQARNIHKA